MKHASFGLRRNVAVVVTGLVLLSTGVWATSTAAEENLVRNPGFEQGADGWSLPETYQVVEGVAHTGTRSLRLTNTDPGRYLLASQNLPLRPGMMYRFSAWVRTQGVAGEDTGATVCMEWWKDQKWLGGCYPGGIKGDRDWHLIEAVTPPIPKDATGLSITLYLRRGMTGTAWFDDVSVTLAYPPALDAVLAYPNYRGQLRSEASSQELVLRAQVAANMKGDLRAEQTTLVMTLLQGEKVIAERRIHGPSPGLQEIRMGAAKLPPGDYLARLEIRSPHGESLERKEFAVRKLPPRTPEPTVWIDEYNRTIVKGKPFFPLGWYFGSHPGSPDFKQHIDRIAESPFNVVMPYGINSGTLDSVRAYLDYLDQRGVKIIYSLKDIYEGTPYYRHELLGFKGEEEQVRGIVGAFRDHPAVLAWYLNDELPLTIRPRLEARQGLVSELDPNHPTWAVLYQVGELWGYLNTADVLGTDPYPVPGSPVTVAGDWTRMTAGVSGGRRPVWQVPQAFDWACYRKEDADKYRAPTLGEVRVMTYLCLIEGAHGLVYYSYFDLQRDRLGFDRRWADMLLVGKEVKLLEPALLSTRKAPKVDVRVEGPARDAVRWTARSDDAGATYLLVANPDPQKVASVRVGVRRGASVQILNHHGVRPLPEAKDTLVRAVSLEPMSAVTVVLKP